MENKSTSISGASEKILNIISMFVRLPLSGPVNVKYNTIEAIDQFIRLHGTPTEPLFCINSDKPIIFDVHSIHCCTKRRRLCRYKGHSFRIGAASFISERSRDIAPLNTEPCVDKTACVLFTVYTVYNL